MKNLVLGMRLALPDFQRGGEILDFNPELTKNWEDSLKANNYEYELLYVRKGIDGYNLGAVKMFMFLEYLKNNKQHLNKVILSDTLDVVFLKPGVFEYMEDNTLYIGDEPCSLGIPWIYENSKSVLKDTSIRNWLDYNRGLQLLNTGLIGGDIEVVIDILEQMVDIITYYCKGYDEGVDMFILNYIAYNSKYKIVNGKPFNSEFRKLDYNNQECFIAHK